MQLRQGQREAFQHRLLSGALEIFRAQGALEQLTVNLVVENPEPITPRPYELPRDQTRCDAVIEYWASDAGAAVDAMRAFGRAGLFEHAVTQSAYVVSEQPVLEEGGGRRAPLKYIGRLRFHEDLPRSAARRSWSVHADLVARAFQAARAYVQNAVDDVIEGDATQAGGIPEMWFDSFVDAGRFLPGAGEQILHDLRHFVSAGSRLYAREHVFA